MNTPTEKKPTFLLAMTFWNNEVSNRIRNVNFTWSELKKLNAYLIKNSVQTNLKLYDFYNTQKLPESIHVPFPSNSFCKSEKLNKIIDDSTDDFFFMFDCDCFFEEKDYPSILNIIQNIKPTERVFFDSAKLSKEYSEEAIVKGINHEWDWLVCKKNNNVKPRSGSYGGVYISCMNIIKQAGKYNESFENWGEDDELGDKVMKISNNYKHETFYPYHLWHETFYPSKPKVKMITCIYSNLYSTEFGGRPSRRLHYRLSLLALLNMDADFICYTSKEEIEDLSNFFYNEYNIDKQKLTLKVFDLNNHHFLQLFKKYKNYEEAKQSDRCIEIQYMKFIWFLMENNEYDYYYWIDSGLSHSGLIPDKYRVFGKNHYSIYFNSILFTPNFLSNLIKESENKFLIIGKENDKRYWSGTVDPIHYKKYDRSYHIIGGLFGGKLNLWPNMVSLFEEVVNTVTEYDKKIYHEEIIMSLLFRNNESLFKMLSFDTWQPEKIENEICFYEIIEKLYLS